MVSKLFSKRQTLRLYKIENTAENGKLQLKCKKGFVHTQLQRGQSKRKNKRKVRVNNHIIYFVSMLSVLFTSQMLMHFHHTAK